MIELHTAAIALHVVTAILGLGLTTATAIAATFARKNASAGALVAPLLARYLVLISASLALMLASGIALDVSAHGAWHATLFFRLGALLLVVIGALGGRSRSVVRALMAPKADSPASFVGIERLAWAMCGATALAALVMVLKPI